MKNKIIKTSIEVRRLTPTEAEVWVSAELERATAETRLSGRLMGPCCPGITTVEVAYPFRQIASRGDEKATVLTVRSIIPEPNLWTEKSPFYYQGPLELWQDNELCDATNVSVALKLK